MYAQIFVNSPWIYLYNEYVRAEVMDMLMVLCLIVVDGKVLKIIVLVLLFRFNSVV